MCEQWVPQQSGVEEMFGEPVCNHPFVQKAVAGFLSVETALEIALMPAEAYTQEKSATGRVAALLVFRNYRPKPHRVFLPPVYENELRFLYATLDEPRELATADEALPTSVSEIRMDIFDFARVARYRGSPHRRGFCRTVDRTGAGSHRTRSLGLPGLGKSGSARRQRGGSGLAQTRIFPGRSAAPMV
jgi:hypothetical protein